MSRYWVYIVRCADGTLYTGVSNDIARRVQQHNAGIASRYTRSRTPVRLAFLEEAGSRSAALKREIEVKKMSRSAKLLLCASYSGARVLSVR